MAIQFPNGFVAQSHLMYWNKVSSTQFPHWKLNLGNTEVENNLLDAATYRTLITESDLALLTANSAV